MGERRENKCLIFFFISTLREASGQYTSLQQRRLTWGSIPAPLATVAAFMTPALETIRVCTPTPTQALTYSAHVGEKVRQGMCTLHHASSRHLRCRLNMMFKCSQCTSYHVFNFCSWTKLDAIIAVLETKYVQCTLKWHWCLPAGVLCGECDGENMGVSALLNKCVSCSDASGLLILALGMLKHTNVARLVLW